MNEKISMDMKDAAALGGGIDSLQVSSQPLYLQVRKHILDHILEKRWNPGEKLPPDVALAAKLGINHITLGKALNMLREEGYLIRHRGRGTFVADQLPVENDKTEPLIAVVFDDADITTFNTKLFVAIHDAFAQYRFRMEFVSSRGSSDLQLQQLVKLVTERHVDGCILWPLLDEAQLKAFLKVCPPLFPLVLLDHQVGSARMNFSGYNDYAAGELLGNHLAEEGFKRCCIFYPQAFAGYSTNRRRRQGLRAGLGFEPEIFTDYAGNHSSAALADTVRRLCGNAEPTALVTISDVDIPLIESLMEKYGNPVHVRLYTFYTYREAEYGGIGMPVAEMGANAAAIIREKLSGSNAVIEKRAMGCYLPPGRK